MTLGESCTKWFKDNWVGLLLIANAAIWGVEGYRALLLLTGISWIVWNDVIAFVKGKHPLNHLKRRGSEE